MTIEQKLAALILGRPKASALQTDAYKNSMAQAGFPLRPESFYLSFRREGLWYNPFDLIEVLQAFKPELPSLKERGFLQTWGYGLTPAMEQALGQDVSGWAVPKGQWFSAKEPIARVDGASFSVSWLEPLAIRLHFPIQVATALVNGERVFEVTTASEVGIICLCAEVVGVAAMHLDITVNGADYYRAVERNAEAVMHALRWCDPSKRAFEVGMRGAVTETQHRLALQACKGAGITRTSNLSLAYELNLIPVGTTGHEHQQRHGPGDIHGFRAIRDSRPESPSYLFDTEEPLLLGVPAIAQVLGEDPLGERRCSVRFDSGDQDAQFDAMRRSEHPASRHSGLAFIFEDGYTAEKTEKNEGFLKKRGFPLERAWYGYGGFLTSAPAMTPYTRSKVSAAYKLCETSGRPVMKWSGSPGKESYPGRIRTFMRVEGDGPDRLVGQEGESDPPGYIPVKSPESPYLTPEPKFVASKPLTVEASPMTAGITVRLRMLREIRIEAAGRR